METTQHAPARTVVTAEDDFDYECALSGIRITLGLDCVPIALHVPAPLFARRGDELARILVTTLAEASAACQRHATESMDGSDGPDDDADGFDPFGDSASGAHLDPGHPAPLDVDDCLSRLHSVANCLTRSHHELLTGTSTATDPSDLVHATANSSGAITALTFSPLLAAEGTDAAEAAIVAATAEAISAANDSRASVIEDALGAVLMNSLAQKWK